MTEPSEKLKSSAVNFFHVLRPLLQLGRVTGLIPLVGTFSRHSNNIAFKWKSFANFRTLAMATLSVAVFILYVNHPFHETSALHRLNTVNNFMFHVTFTFMYIQFWLDRNKLVNLINLWNQTSKQLHFNTSTHKNTIPPRWPIALLMSLSVAENLSHDILSASTNTYDFTLSSQKYLETKFPFLWAPVSHYFHPAPVAWSLFFISKCWAYSWNLIDLFIIVMCQSLTRSFHSLRMTVEGMSDEQLMAETNLENCTQLSISIDEQQIQNKSHISTKADPPYHQNSIDLVTKDFIKLRYLSQQVSKYLSPLFIPAYSFHLILISLHINHWLVGTADTHHYNPNGNSTVAFVFMWTSSIQFVLRMIFVTYFAAGVYHEVKELLFTLQNNLPLNGKRMEQIISSFPVGIDIFGMIVVTRSVFISILSFVFSFQIVLLQLGNGNTSN